MGTTDAMTWLAVTTSPWLTSGTRSRPCLDRLSVIVRWSACRWYWSFSFVTFVTVPAALATEAGQVIRDASERAEQVAREIRAAAEKEAMATREAAAAEAKEARTRALSELRGEVAALAIAAAQKLIGETLDEQRQRGLVQEFFSGIQQGRVLVLEGETLQGSSAEVTSALPLTEEEQEMIRKQLAKPLGTGATMSFRVNPAILGGLVVRLGDKVIDGSVAGKLEGLRQSLR